MGMVKFSQYGDEVTTRENTTPSVWMKRWRSKWANEDNILKQVNEKDDVLYDFVSDYFTISDPSPEELEYIEWVLFIFNNVRNSGGVLDTEDFIEAMKPFKKEFLTF